MSDMISFVDGRAEMAYAGSTPWHRHGTPLADCVSATEMLVEAHMDWEVEKRTLYRDVLTLGIMTKESVKGYKALVRADTGALLAMISDQYHPIQNRQNADILDALVTEGQAEVEVGGVLDGGRRCWLLARVPKTFEIVSGDAVQQYILIAWGHDGEHGVAIAPTPVRVVCHNTLTLALGESWRRGAAVYIRHRANASIKVDEARAALGLVVKRTEVTVEKYRALAARALSVPEVTTYFSGVFPAPQPDPETGEAPTEESVERWLARQQRLAQLYQFGAGANLAGETAWGAYNAVTEWTDHVYPILKSGKLSASREEAVMFGQHAGTKRRALSLALDLAAN